MKTSNCAKPTQSIFRLALLSAIIPILASCGGGGGNACSDLGLKVSNGDSCTFERSPVVLILAADSQGNITSCSGTLITLDDVLTAGHCLAYMTQAIVLTDTHTYNIKAHAFHPLYSPRFPGDVVPFDIAMLTIDGVESIPPVPLLGTDPIAVGEPITVFGYGLNEDGHSLLEREPDDFLRAANMEIGAISTEFATFAAAFNVTGSSICPGDSGGPALQTVNGVSSIVGVSSFDINGCVSDSVAGFASVNDSRVLSFIQGYAPDVSVR